MQKDADVIENAYKFDILQTEATLTSFSSITNEIRNRRRMISKICDVSEWEIILEYNTFHFHFHSLSQLPLVS